MKVKMEKTKLNKNKTSNISEGDVIVGELLIGRPLNDDVDLFENKTLVDVQINDVILVHGGFDFIKTSQINKISEVSEDKLIIITQTSEYCITKEI